jgi:hypothetical protein
LVLTLGLKLMTVGFDMAFRWSGGDSAALLVRLSPSDPLLSMLLMVI